MSFKSCIDTFKIKESTDKEILHKISTSDFILSLGNSFFDKDDSLLEVISYDNLIFCHPIENYNISNKVATFIKYEMGSEEGVMALFVEAFADTASMDDETKSYLSDLDIGYLSSESNIGEEEIEEIVERFKEAKSPVVLVGKDLYYHPRAKNIGKLLAVLEKYGNVQVVTALSSGVTDCKIDEDTTTFLEEIAEIDEYNGSLIYIVDGELKSDNETSLYCSQQFLDAFKVADKDRVSFAIDDRQIESTICFDEKLKGTAALLKSSALTQRYPFVQIKIEKRDV